MNGHVFHQAAPALKAWRETIGWAARAAGAKVTQGALYVELGFVLPRGKTVKRWHPTVPPDLDKLTRACFDSMTGICYVDDAQVIACLAWKVYGDTPGVSIAIWPL